MIEINNLTTSKIDEKKLKKVIKKVLEGENIRCEDLSIALVDPAGIKELNKKYRKQNRVTDILSFSYNGSGEIIICPQVVKKNAKKFALNFKKELAKVLIHGILHLLGYDHEKNKVKAKKMEDKEKYYLKYVKS